MFLQEKKSRERVALGLQNQISSSSIRQTSLILLALTLRLWSMTQKFSVRNVLRFLPILNPTPDCRMCRVGCSPRSFLYENHRLTQLERHISCHKYQIGKTGRSIGRDTKRDQRTHFVPLYRRIPYQWQGFHYRDVDDQTFLQLHHSAGGLTKG